MDVSTWTVDGHARDLQEQVALKPIQLSLCLHFRSNGLFDWLQLGNSTVASMISSESYIFVSIHVFF